MNSKTEVIAVKRKKSFKAVFKRIAWKKIGVVFSVFLLVVVASATSSYITAKLINPQVDNSITTINVSDNSHVVGIVEKISPSVVNVETKSTSYSWFGRRVVSSGAGTGVIISEDGYILTNNHVIEGADEVSITTNTNKDYDAEVVVADSSKDLAIIKVIEKVKLTAATIGNSDEVQVGEEVLAIGNVLGRYPNSVTKGIVSGLGRPIITEGSSRLYGDLHELEDLIQTDTAINSGNSGGPLVNMKGEVIGINTAIDGSAQNIGFSVPINHAKELVDKISQ